MTISYKSSCCMPSFNFAA